ncbi:MAG: HAMP domain-containing sensor histidine kinase [Chloroflexota bacterium]
MTEPKFYPVLFAILIVGVSILSVITYRLWRIWQKARQTNLLWVIVHSNLLTTLMIVALVMIWQGGSTLSALLRLLPETKPLLILTGVLIPMHLSLVVAIPPVIAVMALTALTAYYTAKPIIARLESLGGNMESLEAGDYAVRSSIDGQIELQRLQAGFNNMAAELEKTLQALKQEQDSITHQLETRRELFTEVSHELRTPAATLRAYLDSSLMNWENKPSATLRQDLEVMSHETDRLQRLLDDLFLLARVEVGKLEFETAPIDAETLIQKVVQTVAPLAWERGQVRVIAEISATLPKVWADAGRLEQILHNLLQNGIRHTRPGGIVAVAATVEVETGMVRLEVRDTGLGIEPDELLHIWERFYHGTQAGNTGIGLTLVKELTTAMGGMVAVESTPRQGSNFIIRLRSYRG